MLTTKAKPNESKNQFWNIHVAVCPVGLFQETTQKKKSNTPWTVIISLFQLKAKKIIYEFYTDANSQLKRA